MIRAELTHHQGVKPQVGRRGTSANEAANKAAFAAMSLCEQETGMTVEQLIAYQREMRQAALRRFGVSL